MRSLLLTVASAVVVAASASPAWGGVYHTEDPHHRAMQFTDFRQFKGRLEELRGVVNVQAAEGSLREKYLKSVQALEAEEGRRGLTAEERVNLGAYYLRLFQPEEARRVLEAIPPGRRNFMALANLATAEQMNARLPRAQAYLAQALKNWPAVHPGLTSAQLLWFGRAERLHLALIESRLRESLQPPSREVGLDRLFPRLRLVGPSGEYEAGTLAVEQWSALPADAPALVAQLVIWLPFDDRLYWLLAELLNAAGDVYSAWGCLDELLVQRRFENSRELRRHREVLREALLAVQALQANPRGVLERQAAAALQPLGGALPAGVGPVLDGAAWVVALDAAMKDGKPADPTAATGPSGEAASPLPVGPSATWAPDWRTVVVSFVAGGLFALLLRSQVHEFRRRRHGSLSRA